MSPARDLETDCGRGDHIIAGWSTVPIFYLAKSQPSWWRKTISEPSIVNPQSGGTFTDSLEETGERLMNVLVPGDTSDGESPEQAKVREDAGVRVGSFDPEAGETELIIFCDVEEVKRAIWRMDPKKALGADGITAKILQQSWPNTTASGPRSFRKPGNSRDWS